VFVRLLERRERLDARYPSSLLYRIATNLCLNRIRDRGRRATTADEQHLERIAWAEEPGALGEARLLLDRLFGRHPESSRTIAVLHHVDGLTLEQVAEVVVTSCATTAPPRTLPAASARKPPPRPSAPRDTRRPRIQRYRTDRTAPPSGAVGRATGCAGRAGRRPGSRARCLVLEKDRMSDVRPCLEREPDVLTRARAMRATAEPSGSLRARRSRRQLHRRDSFSSGKRMRMPGQAAV